MTPPFPVLFEDQDLLALAKPAGLPSQATLDKNRPYFYSLAQQQSSTPLYPHHRLDRDTSGVMLFSKSERMNPLLAGLFQNRQIQKTYWALAGSKSSPARQPGDCWRVEDFLELQKKEKPQIMKSVKKGGLKAITEFRVLEVFLQPRSFLIECKPFTGRTHQIRVHLSEGRSPIVGDSMYGGNDSSVPRMMLHAKNLAFQHPLTSERIVIDCELPADFRKVLSNRTAPQPSRI